MKIEGNLYFIKVLYGTNFYLNCNEDEMFKYCYNNYNGCSITVYQMNSDGSKTRIKYYTNTTYKALK